MASPIQFLQDGYGNLSSTRLAFLLWIIGVLGVWGYTSISHPNVDVHIDSSVITLIGILMTGKVVQSFSPNEGPSPGSSKTAPAAAGAPLIANPPQAAVTPITN